MKACFSKRKLIASLALGELDACRARDLRMHIQICDGCRRYVKEISAIRERLERSEPNAEVEASESFHRSLLARLRGAESRPTWTNLAAWLPALRVNWRLVLPTAGAAALVISVIAVFRHQPAAVSRAQVTHPVATVAAVPADLSPTIANYQRVAFRSLDELDDLLTRQAKRRVSPSPVYTASVRALATSMD